MSILTSLKSLPAIKDCYLNLKHPSYLQWPFSSNQSYIELDLYDAPFEEDSYSLKPIALRSIISGIGRGITRKVVIVEGIAAGSGKTTLCWYIYIEWDGYLWILSNLAQH